MPSLFNFGVVVLSCSLFGNCYLTVGFLMPSRKFWSGHRHTFVGAPKGRGAVFCFLVLVLLVDVSLPCLMPLR